MNQKEFQEHGLPLVITSELLVTELYRFCGLLEAANDELRAKAIDHAKAEHAYKRAKAIAYLAASGTVNERTAYVDKACDMEREKAYMARAEKDAALELVRSYRQQLSAMQSIAASARSEMELAGTPYSRTRMQ